MSRRLAHLPALDGLRALAVGLVVAYHLDLGWATGGFIGVDIFFVISGFLITRLLLDERARTGRIALGAFWTRRFKRLVPALVVMIAATLLATHRWGLPEQWNSVRLDAIAGLAYVANWRFVFDQQSYFEAALGPSPLLHTWSLAVEEQWYLLWPVAMVGLLVLTKYHHRRGVGIATAVVATAAVVSAGLMALTFESADPSRAYFGTDTRAQHLLIGAVLAWLVEIFPDLVRAGERRNLRLPFTVSLLVLIALATIIDDTSAWLYRGGLFAISIVAAVVVLGTATEHPDGALAWMGSRPMVWIGRRSYGIYLWHWPVIVFVGSTFDIGLNGTPLIAAQVAITLGLAELSYRFVETPARRSNAPSIRLVAAWSAGACLVAGLGFMALTAPADRRLATSAAILQRPADLSPPSRGSADDVALEADASVSNPTDPGTRRRVLLLGDSAAYSLAQQLDASMRPDWDVQAFVQVGCPLTPGATMDGDSSEVNPTDPDCIAWQDSWPDFTDALQPDVVVVMIGAWEVLDHRVDGHDIRFPSPEWESLVGTALDEAADVAGSSGAPVLFLDVACMGGGPDNPGTTSRADLRRVSAVNALIDGVASNRADVSVAPLSELVCPGGADGLEANGGPVRYDGVHYTRDGAALVWPWLFAQLDEQLHSPGGRRVTRPCNPSDEQRCCYLLAVPSPVNDAPVAATIVATDRANWHRALFVGMAAYVVSRMCVVAGAGVRASQMAVDARADGVAEPTAYQTITNVLTSWDGRWYLELIRRGYPDSIPADITYEQLEARAAFFPVYPWTVRAVDTVLPGGDTFAALFVNFVLGAVAVVLVGLLARRLYSVSVAARAMTLFAVFPGSFVLSFAYSEAVLIVLAARVSVVPDRRAMVARGHLRRRRHRGPTERHRAGGRVRGGELHRDPTQSRLVVVARTCPLTTRLHRIPVVRGPHGR